MEHHADTLKMLQNGTTSLGIELGSTRIKSVLIGSHGEILASGSFRWENSLINGHWTYALEDAISGLQQSYAALARQVQQTYGVPLTRTGSIGISAMMHGYLPLDAEGRQLSAFLTWRNTGTSAAAHTLSELFGVNIPLRWSVAHLYQAILDHAPYLPHIRHLTTLAGYIHWCLTGQYVLGFNDASGMFPLDPTRGTYDQTMLHRFSELIAPAGYPWTLAQLLPTPLAAGSAAGVLTPAGARLLDPTGTLEAGIPLVPPEGDAGTGMVATNSIAVGTGNISAGTSIFSMLVLEKPLQRPHRDIDIVNTPTGAPVAMIHCNNGTSELDAWAGLFRGFAASLNLPITDEQLYHAMFSQSLLADSRESGIIHYNFLSGEPVAGLLAGIPLLMRKPDSPFTFQNFMRSLLFSTLASLVLGHEILVQESVTLQKLTAHGGLFKTTCAAQRYLSAAFGVPVSVMETAGEGGAYGMALLAAYYQAKEHYPTLAAYLSDAIFSNVTTSTQQADSAEQALLADYIAQYKACLPVEAEAVRCLLHPESPHPGQKNSER